MYETSNFNHITYGTSNVIFTHVTECHLKVMSFTSNASQGDQESSWT